MRSIFLLCVLLVLALHEADGHPVSRISTKDYFERQPVLTDSLVSKVNALAKGLWKASVDNGRTLRHRTLLEVKQLLGVHSVGPSVLPARVFTAAEVSEELPETFDSAEHWPQCPTIREIGDQSNCGSCWAIAAAGAMTDRYCTVANLPNHRISTANLLSCCGLCGRGCQGGWPTMAWMWWVWVGLTTEDCQPYPFAPCGHHSASDKYPECPSTIYDTPTCNSTCSDGVTPAPKYKGERSYAVRGEEDYMRELMHNGPFEVALTVYEDFLVYKSGVYSHTTGSELGGHAVRLVGWGTQNGVPYWKIANSWNEDWGDKGHILIRRGTNECGVEDSGVAGIPKRG